MKLEIYHLRYTVEMIKIVLTALQFYSKEVSEGVVLFEAGNSSYTTFIKL